MLKSLRTWFEERRQELAYTDPKRARYWHNPADPIQAARIEAAAVKRARRAKKVERDTNQSWTGNYAHHAAFHRMDDATGYLLPLNLNPFYVAK